MSAIDTTFHWVRNPTAINGLATTYVSKRGNDTTGDGTAQNPYASIAKATSVATANTNIMLDDGDWDEARTSNNKVFEWWGNAKSFLRQNMGLNYDSSTKYHYLIYLGDTSWYTNFENCVVKFVSYLRTAKNSIFIPTNNVTNLTASNIENCIIGNTFVDNDQGMHYTKNCIFFKEFSIFTPSLENVRNCNFLTNPIPTIQGASIVNCINNETTGQTLADYFNYVHPNVLANPSTASIDDWLQCDFTAKEGSKNIGAGEKGTTIGFNQGFTMYADNSADSVFKVSNGATLKNIEWNSTLNGYVLIQKERVCAGATASTIILDSIASSIDDYYNNLFVGIVAGDGYGEIFKITDYDGSTKTATIEGTWNTIPNTSSIYTISGTIFSATKDFGKAIKVKRNWTFVDNFTTIADGRWAEFMTNLTSEGKEFPVNCFLYEYSVDGTTWIQGHTADDLVSATNGENKVTDKIYGDCSQNYDEASARNLVMRYIRVNVHIGFNI